MDKPGSLPVFVYKVLLEHSHIHLHAIWIFLCYKLWIEYLQQMRLFGSQSIKDLLSGPSQEKFADFRFQTKTSLMTRAGRAAMCLAGEFIKTSQLRPVWFRLGFHQTGSSWSVDADAEWSHSRKFCPNGTWTIAFYLGHFIATQIAVSSWECSLGSPQVRFAPPLRVFNMVSGSEKKQVFDPEKFSGVGHYRLSWSLGEDPTCSINPAFQTGLIVSLASYNQN